MAIFVDASKTYKNKKIIIWFTFKFLKYVIMRLEAENLKKKLITIVAILELSYFIQKINELLNQFVIIT